MIPPPFENKTGGAFAAMLRRAAAIVFLLLLAGYLIFNRSFALLGFPPFYVGEMALGVALFAAFFDFKNVFIEPLKRSRAMQFVALFMFYGMARVAIDAPSRGMDAARDGVICLYAVAAFLGPWLLADKTGSDTTMRMIQFLAPVTFLALVWAGGIYLGWIHAPANVKVDFLTLSAAVAFAVWASIFSMGAMRRLCELRTNENWRSREFLIKLLRLLGFYFFTAIVFCAALLLLLSMPTRAIQLSFFISFVMLSFNALAGSLNKRKVAMFGFAIVVVMTISIWAAYEHNNGQGRERMDALIDPNEQHFATRQGQIAAHSVKWRLVFWTRCIDETTRRAPVFGFGFGTNLTDLLRGTPEWPMFEDSQNAAKYGSPNRNPHSAHVTIFTRLGGTGLIVWLGLLGAVFARGLRNCWEKRVSYRFGPPDRFAAEHASFVAETTLLSVWSVYLLAMSFGVVLENPFGGIWFWTLTGVIASRRNE